MQLKVILKNREVARELPIINGTYCFLVISFASGIWIVEFADACEKVELASAPVLPYVVIDGARHQFKVVCGRQLGRHRVT